MASRTDRSKTGRPLTNKEPVSGEWTPARIFMSVLLPAPFSPTTESTSPGISRRLTELSALTPGKDLLMPCTSSRGVVSAVVIMRADRLVRELLTFEPLEFFPEGFDVFRGDGPRCDVDVFGLWDDILIAAQIFLQNANGLIAVLVGILNNGSGTFSVLDGLECDIVFVETSKPRSA
jgi:hypothetical protein